MSWEQDVLAALAGTDKLFAMQVQQNLSIIIYILIWSGLNGHREFFLVYSCKFINKLQILKLFVKK